MANVFYSPYADTKPVSWALQNCFIYIPKGTKKNDGVLAATQGVQITFGRSLSKRYPLTGTTPITLIGIPQGTCQITTILGPTHNVETFLQKFGSTCQPFELVVGTEKSQKAQECQGTHTPQVLTMKGCQGASISFSLSTQENIVIAQGVFNIQFDTLLWGNSIPAGA